MNSKKSKVLENTIGEISVQGHDENLLQQLIREYLNIYLAKDYQKLGDYIDLFKSTSESLDSGFFGQIIKWGGGISICRG